MMKIVKEVFVEHHIAEQVLIESIEVTTKHIMAFVRKEYPCLLESNFEDTLRCLVGPCGLESQVRRILGPRYHPVVELEEVEK